MPDMITMQCKAYRTATILSGAAAVAGALGAAAGAVAGFMLSKATRATRSQPAPSGLAYAPVVSTEKGSYSIKRHLSQLL